MRVMAPCRIGGVLTILSLVALSHAGPLGPLPNATSADVGLKEGSCVLGDVVYMSGDTFTGATPCERCACAGGSVQCAQERCEPRPGCKALHRPDHCCPTYQCECEQEGRVYGNGEKLVDPEDPCRVCYCQGGEVVCRRIACFVRDDCQPRLVPGRCCPEYDNCPLRGVTTIPGLVPPAATISTTESIASSPAPTPQKENIKQKITIKEITPVSEIPVITDVKIKEILPSPSIEVPEYPSSKSPLIPREAILDKSAITSAETPKTEESLNIELISPLPTDLSSKSAEKNLETKSTADMLPSKISLSTQDSINSEIYPSHIPTIIATVGIPLLTPDGIPVASTTRVAIIEEEDSNLFDHNPAFPPIPDDLSVPHEDEILPEQNADNVHGEQHVASTLSPSTLTVTPREIPTTTVKPITETTTTTTTTTTEKQATEPTSTTTMGTPEVETSTTYLLTSTTVLNNNPMLDVRAALPHEILKVPSSVPEDITGDLDDPEESVTAFDEPLYSVTSTTSGSVTKAGDETTTPQLVFKDKIYPRSSEITNTPIDTTTETTQSVTSKTTISTTKLVDDTTVPPQIITKDEYGTTSSQVTNNLYDTTTQTVTSTTNEATSKLVDETTATPYTIASTVSKNKILPRSNEATNTPFDTTTQTTQKLTDAPEILSTKVSEEFTTVTVSKPNIPTEVTAQTEFSSLSIETSDQNPHDASETVPREKSSFTTKAPLTVETTTGITTTDFVEPAVTRAPLTQSTTENLTFETNVETTEFVLTSFGSSESTTDTVEIIKISPTQKVKNAAIIDSSPGRKSNVLTDLFDLVGDVASMSAHTDAPEVTFRTTTSNILSESEELMPVNAGYKSKNSNFNLNSITEIPLKSKNQVPVNKQKVVEIEDEDTDSIADALPPHDKVEPTTRRPIIDNVSDSVPKNETEKKDIEIISQSYVPTISRRPTKVVMKKNNDMSLSDVSTAGTTDSSDMTTSLNDGTASPTVNESGLSSGELATADPIVNADGTTLTPAQ